MACCVSVGRVALCLPSASGCVATLSQQKQSIRQGLGSLENFASLSSFSSLSSTGHFRLAGRRGTFSRILSLVVRAAEEGDEERLRLSNLAPQPGSRKRNKRKGRGIAAGQGASCGFGMRGQKSRSGSGVRPGFEGGQMPLYRRLPKLRGIAGGMGAGLPKYVTVNLADLASLDFKEGDEVTLEVLKEKRLINPSGRERKLPLKVLGDGELDVKLSIKAGKFSASAKSKLDALGCTLEELPGKKKFLCASAVKALARTDAFFAKKRGEAGSF
eukprot:TRINITY_DN2619_c0_g1_i1.p1 TRINITY_DN2619_c0_g1~~TRINITY_DN2619_c0_g1_i1.p1  ORF type:complete len:272 (+),score=44.12 TRINITY_DN2619_c0_g1_i1:101-916(+)